MSDEPMASEKQTRSIALFDLDGTLLAWDCQLLFRRHILRHEPWRIVFFPLYLALLPFWPVLGIDGMKRVFHSYLWKVDHDLLDGYLQSFVEELRPLFYREMLDRIEHHRRCRDLLVLSSASPEFYVRAIARELGMDLGLGTQIEWHGIFPDMENHKGMAKVERLQRELPRDLLDGGQLKASHGYSDSSADVPMLLCCESVTLVNPSPAFTHYGQARGWEMIRVERPWRSRLSHAWQSLNMLLGFGR
ncbi:MAG: hypothetical protein EAZ42_07245 [Verrucomicrobia bacterium]|nr:MAG: hypothetical protein EAZ42_07245 [Verrucomicrobiota bacterium]